MIRLVRSARGKTQAELAIDAGISQAALSKAEAGAVDLDETRLADVAAALRVPVSRFTASALVDGFLSACAFHRKRSSLAVSDANRIRAMLNLTLLQAEDIFGGDAPAVEVPRVTVWANAFDSPVDIAGRVRAEMGLSDGPVSNLVAAIEQIGAVVEIRNLGADRIDAIGTWPPGHRPIFILNERAPADRRRFTLAHELGHAVMHDQPSDDQEREADRFASELLMPEKVIRAELTGVDIAKLARLKQRWGVSMAALLRRARDLAAISEADYKRLNIEMSKAGYRTSEPGFVAAERPHQVTDAVRSHLDRGESIAQISKRVHMLPEEFNDLYVRPAA